MNKKYWLWTGIAFSIIGLITPLCVKNIPILTAMLVPAALGSFVVPGILGCPFFERDWSGHQVAAPYCHSAEILGGIIVSVIIYSLLGMLIGVVYGKIKNR